MEDSPIFVIKRDGRREDVDFMKVDKRLNKLNSHPYQLKCNASFVAQKVRDTIQNNIATTMLDEYAAKVASEFATYHPHFLILAARIAVSNHQKNTQDCFSECVKRCYNNISMKGEPAPRVNQQFYKFVIRHATQLNTMVDYERDFRLSYFAFSTLIDRYLIKRSGDPKMMELRPQDFAIERPQDMWMRAAVALCMNRHRTDDESVLPMIKKVYDGLSMGEFMVATPALYNLGTLCEQALSCYLVGGDDSIEGIGKLIGDCMKMSKMAGGIGQWWDLRSAGSEVRTTNGKSDGPIPFLGVLEKAMLATDQGGKRPGSCAVYMEPTHPDFMRWVVLRRPSEPNKIDKLFYAAWVPDEFMRRVASNSDWYFVDPDEQPQLYRLYGDEWTAEYNRIIATKGYRGKPISARKMYEELCQTQSETGMPYVLFKDACNRKSNHRAYARHPDRVGCIKCSNLCAEILEYSDSKEYGCCCLGTICLASPVYFNADNSINYEKIAENAGILTYLLNRIIDINTYPVEEARRSNMLHRPIAIGIQGLANMAHILKMSFTGSAFRVINRQSMEAIYYGACEKSCALAREIGPYDTFAGSPFSEGKFQFDLWEEEDKIKVPLMWQEKWDELRPQMVKYGMRNSLLTSLPPTASTSLIQNNNECHEPFMSNITTRKTLSGEFIVINEYLIEELQEMKLWNQSIRQRLIKDRGSIKSWEFLPEEMRQRYATAWEMDIRDLIDMDADRAPFVDQTMSSNRFMANPTVPRIMTMHFRAWRKGLKTGMYYLRMTNASKAQQFTVAIESKPVEEKPPQNETEELSCELKKINGVMCISCGV